MLLPVEFGVVRKPELNRAADYGFSVDDTVRLGHYAAVDTAGFVVG